MSTLLAFIETSPKQGWRSLPTVPLASCVHCPSGINKGVSVPDTDTNACALKHSHSKNGNRHTTHTKYLVLEIDRRWRTRHTQRAFCFHSSANVVTMSSLPFSPSLISCEPGFHSASHGRLLSHRTIGVLWIGRCFALAEVSVCVWIVLSLFLIPLFPSCSMVRLDLRSFRAISQMICIQLLHQRQESFSPFSEAQCLCKRCPFFGFFNVLCLFLVFCCAPLRCTLARLVVAAYW